jgi:site-specific recombinase XerD
MKNATLQAVIDELLIAKKAANRRPAYLRHLKFSLRKFAEGREQSRIRDITRQEIEGWLAKRNDAPVTRKNWLTVLSVLFQHAIKLGAAKVSPVAQIDRVTIDRQPPRILTPAEARRMMLFAKRRMQWRLPQIVLGLYAGIRPSELARLYWRDIDLERGYVTVDAAAAKTRRRRIVQLDPKAVLWLKAVRKPNLTKPIGCRSSSWKWRRLIEENCGIKWGQDCLRHSAASYLIAKHGDLAKVSRLLGNSVQVLMDHYFNLVKPEDSRRFWKVPTAIRPPRPQRNERTRLHAEVFTGSGTFTHSAAQAIVIAV